MDSEEISRKKEIEKQVQVLLMVAEKMKENKKNPLLEEFGKVNLQFTTKKQVRTEKTIKINLPNGLGELHRDVCLFVKDLDRKDREYEKSVRHFKEFLKLKGITSVSEIIPLKALKLEHKPFEAKRNLAKRFDVFLADARIIRLLPSFLGKAFYGKKKNPIQVRMDASDLKAEFEEAINNTRCILKGKGTVAMVTVGTTGMSAAELVQNITASICQIEAAVPGGAQNIRNIYIKTEDSLALPVYVSEGSSNEVTLPVEERKQEPVIAEEVTTVENALVKVFPNGVVQLVDESGTVIENKKKFHARQKKSKVKRLGKKLKSSVKQGKKLKTSVKQSKKKNK